MADIDEAGNEIMDALFRWSDWASETEPPPESIAFAAGSKSEGHPRAWIEEITNWPALFVHPLAWPTNRRIGKQDEHLFTCEVFVIIAAEAGTQPYRLVREAAMKVKRNIVGAFDATGYILGLSYLADMRWVRLSPENEMARFYRERNMPFAAASIALDLVTYSEAEDFGG